MPGSFEGLSSGLPTASELGLSGIFAGNYSAAKGITEETISQINDLKGYAQSQATQIEDAVEALLAASQVALPEIPNFGTAMSLQGALATLPDAPAEPTIDSLPIVDLVVPQAEPGHREAAVVPGQKLSTVVRQDRVDEEVGGVVVVSQGVPRVAVIMPCPMSRRSARRRPSHPQRGPPPPALPWRGTEPRRRTTC